VSSSSKKCFEINPGTFVKRGAASMPTAHILLEFDLLN